MNVYRIQDKDGRGPWKPGFSHKWVSYDRPESEYGVLIPWLNEFGAVHRYALSGMHIGCGCLELTQMRRWFLRHEYEKLMQYGYRSVKLDATSILAASEIQCVFQRIKPLKEDVEPFELY